MIGVKRKGQTVYVQTSDSRIKIRCRAAAYARKVHRWISDRAGELETVEDVQRSLALHDAAMFQARRRSGRNPWV